MSFLKLFFIVFITSFLLVGCDGDDELKGFDVNSEITFPKLGDNPRWEVLVHYSDQREDYTEVYEYDSDTIFCGYTYQKVVAVRDEIERILCYVRSDANKVFVRTNNNCNEKEYLLYDFSLDEGEAVKCGFHLFSNLVPKEIDFLVESDDIIRLNEGIEKNTLLMKYSYNGSDYFEMNWIEGIGSDINPFYPLTISNYPGGGIHTLISFKFNGVELLSY